VAQGGIDVVLMDLQMPVVDGLEGARLIRCGPHQPYIVALTAFAFSSHQRECEAAGMNDFLTKPIRLPELQASLERCKGFRQAASP
jgi:CheY-like chemotaxis protein